MALTEWETKPRLNCCRVADVPHSAFEVDLKGQVKHSLISHISMLGNLIFSRLGGKSAAKPAKKGEAPCVTRGHGQKEGAGLASTEPRSGVRSGLVPLPEAHFVCRDSALSLTKALTL